MLRVLLLALLPTALMAETVVPTRTIRAGQTIAAGDVTVMAGTVEGSFENPEDVLGQEARVTLYAKRPIGFDQIGPPAVVDRNQIVPLAYHAGGLQILTEGRALARGGVGDAVRVMNLSSRSTVTGIIGDDGTVYVGNTP
ncbi:flagellar basal body P-ring formation chaperone FlgA [Gemmobacter sp. JM10B15]|uniref:Flagella basal body P-ring formation protein FlgA n=2 Tax=Gemmobacter denitrificans TaxID=3123040 RepID=A0ABU8BVD6_9RHOB